MRQLKTILLVVFALQFTNAQTLPPKPGDNLNTKLGHCINFWANAAPTADEKKCRRIIGDQIIQNSLCCTRIETRTAYLIDEVSTVTDLLDSCCSITDTNTIEIDSLSGVLANLLNNDPSSKVNGRVKLLDETITNDQQTDADTNLSVKVEAFSIYRFEFAAFAEGDSAALKVTFDVPPGASLKWTAEGIYGINKPINGTGDTLLFPVTPSPRAYYVRGYLFTLSSPGDFSPMWSQDKAHPGDLTLFRNSAFWTLLVDTYF